MATMTVQSRTVAVGLFTYHKFTSFGISILSQQIDNTVLGL